LVNRKEPEPALEPEPQFAFIFGFGSRRQFNFGSSGLGFGSATLAMGYIVLSSYFQEYCNRKNDLNGTGWGGYVGGLFLESLPERMIEKYLCSRLCRKR
jgi:hypothetical protein